VIRLPLTTDVIFNLYHVLPLPIRIRETKSKFVFIQPENEYLLVDSAKRYFTVMKVNEVHECKIVNEELRVCKQSQPLQLANLNEVCESQMIEPIRTIPASCSKRIVDLNHTLWKQINGNELLFVAPVPDVLTVLCSKHEPMDVKLSGTGKLQLNPLCKAYGSRILIQSHATIVTNRTNKDIIPPMSLEYDCCGSINKNFKLNELHLHVPLRSVAGSLDDLKVASHRVEDIEKLNFEQEQKVKHSTVDSQLSFLLYVGMATTGLTLVCFSYCCCCKCCQKLCPKLSRWWKDNNPCTTIIFKPKIVTSIHSSRESVRGSNSRAIGRTRRSITETAETSELVCLNANKKSIVLSGKR